MPQAWSYARQLTESISCWAYDQACASFEDRLEMQLLPGSGWNFCQISSFEDRLEVQDFPGFGWTSPRMSSFEDRLEMHLLPGSGWNYRQMSSVEDRLEIQLLPGFGWNLLLNVKLWRPPGGVTPCKLWLNGLPTASDSRLPGSCKSSPEEIPAIPVSPLIGLPQGLAVDGYNAMIRHAENISVGTEVQESVAAFSTTPCSCNVWRSVRFEFPCCSVIFLPFLEGSCCEAIWCTSWRAEVLRLNLHPSPFRHTTLSSTASEKKIMARLTAYPLSILSYSLWHKLRMYTAHIKLHHLNTPQLLIATEPRGYDLAPAGPEIPELWYDVIINSDGFSTTCTEQQTQYGWVLVKGYISQVTTCVFPNLPWYLQNLILWTLGLRFSNTSPMGWLEVAGLPSRLLAFLPHGQGWSLGTYGNRNLEASHCRLFNNVCYVGVP